MATIVFKYAACFAQFESGIRTWNQKMLELVSSNYVFSIDKTQKKANIIFFGFALQCRTKVYYVLRSNLQALFNLV